jgi:hypothetical protein
MNCLPQPNPSARLLIESTLEINGAGEAEVTSAPRMPVIRSLNLSSIITQAVLGKTALVGSDDDVTANRRYEVEVTVTRAKGGKPCGNVGREKLLGFRPVLRSKLIPLLFTYVPDTLVGDVRYFLSAGRLFHAKIEVCDVIRALRP